MTNTKNFVMTNEYLSMWSDYIRVNFHRDNDIICIYMRETGQTTDVPYAKIRSFDELLLKVQAAVAEMMYDVTHAIAVAKEMCDILTESRDTITSFINEMKIVYINIPDKIRVQHKELRLTRLCPIYKYGQLEYSDVDCENCWHADSEGYCHECYDDWIQLESEHHITCRGIWNNYTDNTTKYAKFWLLEDDKEFFDDELGVDVVDFDEIIADMMDLDVNTVVKIDGIDDCTANTVEWLSLYLKDRIKVLKW